VFSYPVNLLSVNSTYKGIVAYGTLEISGKADATGTPGKLVAAGGGGTLPQFIH
jgi:hypothetical protein